MESLTGRVDRIIRAHRDELLLSTTPTEVTIGELIKRSEGLEKAIRELAAELEKRGTLPVSVSPEEATMSETQGDEQIGQHDERHPQPEEPMLGEEAPVGSGGIPNPGHTGAPNSSESGRPEDVAEEGRPDQETIQEETPGVR